MAPIDAEMHDTTEPDIPLFDNYASDDARDDGRDDESGDATDDLKHDSPFESTERNI